MDSDEKLIQRAANGDVEAFESLYKRHRDGVYRLAWRFTRDHQLALDVLQETFTYLLKKLPGFVLTSKLTTYLYPVIKHLAFEMIRKNNRMVCDDMAIAELSFQPALPTEETEDLAAVLSVLPAAQREVLLMRFMDNMNLQEIANALEIPLGTVKSRLHKALAALRGNRQTRQYFLGQ